MKQLILLAALLPCLCSTSLQAQATAPDAKTAFDDIATRSDSAMRLQLARRYAPVSNIDYEDFALAAYWLNERTAEADEAILTEREKVFPKHKSNVFFNANVLERIYLLFGSLSKHFPGRMSAKAEAALLDMLWQWAGPMCRLEMASQEHDWQFWTTENLHSVAMSGFCGAAQIFADHPDYKNRRYADGTAPAQMAAAFSEFYKRYARNIATRGLLVECNSNYNKYTLDGWYNMADFADDPELRRRMTMLLDLYWADWAIEEINGVRGGSRHRCYTGSLSTTSAPMEEMSWYHFGLGKAHSLTPAMMCPATTLWRPSPVVATLALDWNGRGVYEYYSRRPGLAWPNREGEPVPNYVSDPKHPFFQPKGNARLRPEGGGLLRYTYCTPDFVLGTSMVQALPELDWVGLSSQNRWEGVIFADHPTARIFTQPLKPKAGSVYNAEWSVQKRGVLIVQRLKTSNAKGQRVWFDAALERDERDGWVFATAPKAYAAVRVVDGGQSWEPDTADQHHDGQPDNGMWLKCTDEFSPVIIEVARKADCKDFAAFQTAILGNALKRQNHRLDYTSTLNHTTLTLFADYSQPPQVDGVPVNYAAEASLRQPLHPR